ncbi:MAG: peptidoglycan DD-metalloendopeptidase family protein [Pseudomonas sp.]|uniref:peptidoglycan DD-metalloendopeptidase family protein n=1 Tax=Pseudomonas abieticivorans TaxID=2931382 RepID=UPI0020BE6665|nr:peptidoglycan DD-metalloendopeptidase family protein [Pseudomonas sp. PIA16]MDE1168789.1 peptidoglycan DD-metalloendopeptidase family protein [Pseudomonas sp.]
MPLRTLLICGLFLASSHAAAATIYKYTDANGVTTYTDRPTRNAQVFVFRDQMVEHLEQQVHLDVQKHNGATTFAARNELFAPVEVQLRLDGLGNVRGSQPKVIHRIVPARATVALATLTAQQPGQPVRYAQKFRYALGDPSATPRAYRYPLPWLGGPFRLTQGPNGKYSHFGPKGRYAMDIAMPEGTPIVAARAGTVVKVENNQMAGQGGEPSGNFVRVLHDDGTMGVYLHLMHGSVSVREGQHVNIGTALARSGNTGNSSGPHLHFVIQRNVGLALESIPYDFNQPVGTLPNFALGNQ